MSLRFDLKIWFTLFVKVGSIDEKDFHPPFPRNPFEIEMNFQYCAILFITLMQPIEIEKRNEPIHVYSYRHDVWVSIAFQF